MREYAATQILLRQIAREQRKGILKRTINQNCRKAIDNYALIRSLQREVEEDFHDLIVFGSSVRRVTLEESVRKSELAKLWADRICRWWGIK